MVDHIKINAPLPRIQYIANGQTSDFEYPFAIFNDENLKIYLGSELQDPSVYTIENTDDSEGGTVQFLTPPEAGTVITLVRDLSIQRTTDFQEGGALRASVLNSEFDFQIACQQQIADNLNRSMILPPYALDTNVSLTLPMPMAGKAIVWNSDGTNLENSTIPVNELEGTLKEYKEIAKSQALLATEKAAESMESASTAVAQAAIALQAALDAQTAMNCKAGTNMDNLTQTGTNKIVNCVMPDRERAISLPIPFTAPYDCECFISAIWGVNAIAQYNLGSHIVGHIEQSTATTINLCFQMKKGDVLTKTGANPHTVYLSEYYPLKGGSYVI